MTAPLGRPAARLRKEDRSFAGRPRDSGRTRGVGFMLSAMLLGAAAAAAATVWAEYLVIAAPGVLALLLLVAVRGRLGPSALSPIKIVVVGYLAIAILGLLFFDRVADARTGAGIRLYPTRHTEIETVRLLLVAAAAVAVGSFVTILALPFGGNIGGKLRPVVASNRTRWKLLVMSVVPAVLTTVDRTPAALLRRDTYLRPAEQAAGFADIGPSLSVPALLGLGYVLAVGRRSQRVVALPLVAVFTAQFFALGSRRMTLIPLLLAAGALAATRSRRAKMAVGFGAAASLLLSPLPLYLRGLSSHGLIPYAQAVPDYLRQPFDYKSTALSILVTFALVGTVAYVVAPIPAADFGSSLSPLPGAYTGWYDIQPNHTLNPFTPYVALGELGNSGLLAVIAYCLVVGALLAYFDYRVRVFLSAGRQLAALALVGFSGLFMLFSLEYFLRTASRFLYYAILFDIAIRVLGRMRTDRRGPAEPGPPAGSSVGAERAGPALVGRRG